MELITATPPSNNHIVHSIPHWYTQHLSRTYCRREKSDKYLTDFRSWQLFSCKNFVHTKRVCPFKKCERDFWWKLVIMFSCLHEQLCGDDHSTAHTQTCPTIPNPVAHMYALETDVKTLKSCVSDSSGTDYSRVRPVNLKLQGLTLQTHSHQQQSTSDKKMFGISGPPHNSDPSDQVHRTTFTVNLR